MQILAHVRVLPIWSDTSRRLIGTEHSMGDESSDEHSVGQSHADAAENGWCPKGRRSEDGTIPERYCLRETASREYAARTEANVVDSDATVVFTKGARTGGTLLTVKLAQKHRKPCHVADVRLGREEIVAGILEWLEAEVAPTVPQSGHVVLNVAGPRESKVRGMERAVMILLSDVLRLTNEACRKFYPLTDKGSIVRY